MYIHICTLSVCIYIYICAYILKVLVCISIRIYISLYIQQSVCNICIYKCIYLYIDARKYICMDTYCQTCLFAATYNSETNMHMCMQIFWSYPYLRVHTCIHIQLHVHIQMHTRIRICLYTYLIEASVSVCVYVYIYMYTYIYTQEYTHGLCKSVYMWFAHSISVYICIRKMESMYISTLIFTPSFSAG